MSTILRYPLRHVKACLYFPRSTLNVVITCTHRVIVNRVQVLEHKLFLQTLNVSLIRGYHSVKGGSIRTKFSRFEAYVYLRMYVDTKIPLVSIKLIINTSGIFVKISIVYLISERGPSASYADGGVLVRVQLTPNCFRFSFRPTKI